MKRLLRHRPSPALVVASLALLVALSGTSVASVTQLLPRNSVGTKQLQPKSVTGPKIRDKAIGPRKIATNAVTTEKVRNRSLRADDFAPGELPAGPPGPAGPAGAAGPSGPAGPAGSVTRLTAVVLASGSIARSQGTSGASRLGVGQFEVVFTQDVAGCTYLGTMGQPNAILPIQGEIMVTPRVGNTSAVHVYTRSSDGLPADRPFHLIVVC
ncbi:MAG TPA: hypothetical protein VFU99_06330 [Gaiellaceae bacterium]|nr:hypothetical protein [Gaiellaceae bacterium]